MTCTEYTGDAKLLVTDYINSLEVLGEGMGANLVATCFVNLYTIQDLSPFEFTMY